MSDLTKRLNNLESAIGGAKEKIYLVYTEGEDCATVTGQPGVKVPLADIDKTFAGYDVTLIRIVYEDMSPDRKPAASGFPNG